MILLPIYPAREEPILGITSDALLEKINLENKHLFNASATLEYLTNVKEGVIVTIGAGDIDRMVENIKKIVNENLKLL